MCHWIPKIWIKHKQPWATRFKTLFIQNQKLSRRNSHTHTRITYISLCIISFEISSSSSLVHSKNKFTKMLSCRGVNITARIAWLNHMDLDQNSNTSMVQTIKTSSSNHPDPCYTWSRFGSVFLEMKSWRNVIARIVYAFTTTHCSRNLNLSNEPSTIKT